MNKSRGLLAGAFVAAAFVFRIVGANPEPVAVPSGPPHGIADAKGPPGDGGFKSAEGPWIASCRYWAPARDTTSSDHADANTSPTKVSVSVQDQNAHVDIQAASTELEQQDSCGVETARWGFPVTKQGDVNRRSPDVSVTVAIVPDPVHTHLSLAFDRTVQVLLQAAADNGFVDSYYWLPWRAPHLSIRSAESDSEKEVGHSDARERQPGLIILKHNPDPAGDVSLPTSFDRVVYVFLVAETPTEGIDGYQLQRALAYRKEIRDLLTKLTPLGGDEASIIGPTYSGSAASLRAGIEQACLMDSDCPKKFSIRGVTETVLSAKELMESRSPKAPELDYYSFGPQAGYDMNTFLASAVDAGYDPAKIAVLTEDSTVFGSTGVSYDGRQDRLNGRPRPADPDERILYMHFPREISLLRNTPIDAGSGAGNLSSSGTIPSPYLHFSVKDANAQDSVVQFSREHSPLSQESQLMAMAREIKARRSELIAISASDRLDMIFLALFFRRACPDARLVFLESDLLAARDADNLPYVGSITVSPYLFMTKLFRDKGIGGQRVYTDSESEGYYNASSFTFWKKNIYADLPKDSKDTPRSVAVPLEGYRERHYSPAAQTPDQLPAQPLDIGPPFLWASVLGTDGYYPLGVLSPCSNNPKPPRDPTLVARFIPQIHVDANGDVSLVDSTCSLNEKSSGTPPRGPIHPSLQWEILCGIIAMLCIVHGSMFFAADYRSWLTADLDVPHNDQPERRALYIRVSTAMLTSMAFVVVIPIFVLEPLLHFAGVNVAEAVATTILAVAALVVGFLKTRGHMAFPPMSSPSVVANGAQPPSFIVKCHAWLFDSACPLLNFAATLTSFAVPAAWVWICFSNSHAPSRLATARFPDMVGFAFAFRCIHPFNGVSPILPVLLLLFAWYIWGLFQTWRMCFSPRTRPRLPVRLDDGSDPKLFVSDEELHHSQESGGFGLYQRLSCLAVTRCMARQLFKTKSIWLDVSLCALYGCAWLSLSLFSPFKSIDRQFWIVRIAWPGPYDALLGALFFPLFWCSFSGWLRLVLVWSALKRELLVPLENQPIRFAFSRLQGKGWMTVLSRVGRDEQSRDRDRCVESMRQILHLPDLRNSLNMDLRQRLHKASRVFLHDQAACPTPPSNFIEAEKLELYLASFTRELLACVLVPFWQNERTGLVESTENESLPLKARRTDYESESSHLPIELQAGPSSVSPARILAAEEFLAMRYMTLIRAVLGNMRYMMMFFSVTFVLAIVAWNSYPFQPRQIVDWLFTAFLALLGVGMVWTFAQMHRDPILSRVTATRPNELGWDFYLRVISFGAIPVFTWLAYEFPDVGSAVYSFLQPGSSVFK